MSLSKTVRIMLTLCHVNSHPRQGWFPYLTGGQMIHPRRPVLRTRKRCPPPVVM
jgi:hypothetical protein